jgi:hypothetical protein
LVDREQLRDICLPHNLVGDICGAGGMYKSPNRSKVTLRGGIGGGKIEPRRRLNLDRHQFMVLPAAPPTRRGQRERRTQATLHPTSTHPQISCEQTLPCATSFGNCNLVEESSKSKEGRFPVVVQFESQ